MRFKIYIALLVCSLYSVLCTPLRAITTEQEQQFTYYWYAAKQAIAEERYSDAYMLLEFCHALNPEDGNTSALLGVIYESLGEHGKAFLSFKAAFESDPYDHWYRYSQILQEEGNAEGQEAALEVLEKAHEVQLAVKKHKAKGESMVDEDLLNELMTAYVKSGEFKKALEIQDEIDGQKGYDAYSALARYKIYLMWRKPKKAIEAIDRYLEQDPTDLRFLLMKVELLQYVGTSQKTLYSMYDRILEISPYHLTTLNNYAYHLATHGGDLKEAERMSSITIREEPNNPVYLDTYGWILHMSGKDSLAIFFLNRAAKNATPETKTEIDKHLKAITNKGKGKK